MSHVIGAFVLWYVYFNFEYAINGGGAGRNPYLMVFQLFWQDILWSIPGGLKRKTAFIKERFGSGNVCIAGSKRNWEWEDVVRDNLYEDCAKDTLPGPVGFWAKTITVSAFGALLGDLITEHWPEVLVLCFIMVAYRISYLYKWSKFFARRW